MDKEKEYHFLKLYEQLASLTQNENQDPEVQQIEALLKEIAAMFRLARGEVHFYRNPGDEQRGVGERNKTSGGVYRLSSGIRLL